MPLLGDYTNRSYAQPFYDIVLRQLDEVGVDALWVDWQVRDLFRPTSHKSQ